jgi:hypothetical protein
VDTEHSETERFVREEQERVRLAESDRPVHGRLKRCPTCNSHNQDPSFGDPDIPDCPDPWHSRGKRCSCTPFDPVSPDPDWPDHGTPEGTNKALKSESTHPEEEG